MSMTVSALFVAPSGRRREQRLARHRHGCGERRRQPRREPVGCGTDAAGRLASVTVGGVVQAEYRYNHLGQQAVRSFPGSGLSIHSVYGPDGNRIAEFDGGTGALIREYVWLDGAPVAVIEGGQVYFVRSDHIGRPVFATTSAGTVVWTASYLPFGGVHVATGAPIDARFPGQWFQAESGLHQNWMRDYDPTTGRYLEPDPLGLVDGASVYGYARQSPLRWTDFWGLTAICPVSPPWNVPGWKAYPGNSSIFHCGYDGYVEDRVPTPEDPVAECFYDEKLCLVDENHPYAQCRGTADQYSASDWWNHTFNDSGGIWEHGVGAFGGSMSHWWNAP